MTDLASQIQQLYSQFGELEGITIELHKELIAIVIHNNQARAQFFLQGAQITHFQPHKKPEYLWLSPDCSFQAKKAVRGGIPICWPWFGNLANNPEAITKQFPQLDQASQSAHGFVRTREWTLESIEQPSADLTIATMSLLLDGNDSSWSYKTKLSMVISISNTLSIRLIVDNLSSETVHFSTALHSYFSASSIEDITIRGLEGVSYYDALDNWQASTEQQAIRIDGEVDRVYINTPSTINLEDIGFMRCLQLTSKSSSSAIIWNPWIDKAQRLTEFPDDGYESMVCIETANAMDDIKQLAPGDSYSLDLTISDRPVSH